MPRITPLGQIRRKVCDRADGTCECCGVWIGYAGELGHLDHMFGRKHAPETVATCWLLCVHCDHDKTNNHPSAVWWLTRFSEHAGRWGYSAEWERASVKMAVLMAKFPDAGVA